MMLKLDKIKDQLQKIIRRLSKYRYLLIGVVIIGLFTYTVSIINRQLNQERDQAAYDEARLNIEKVEFDQDAVKAIVRSRDLKVDVDAIFAPGRTNPFE